MRTNRKTRGGLAPEKYLTEEQLAKLRDYAQSRARKYKGRDVETDHLIIEILCLSGLRAAELCALEIRDLPCSHGKPAIEVRKGKGAVARPVLISDALASHIARYVGAFRKEAGAGEPLFLSMTGRPIAYRVVYNKVKRLMLAVGIARVRDKPDRRQRDCACHTLRHTYATRLYAQERDLAFVCDQLGHTNINTTTIYARTAPEAARRQVNAIK